MKGLLQKESRKEEVLQIYNAILNIPIVDDVGVGSGSGHGGVVFVGRHIRTSLAYYIHGLFGSKSSCRL